MESNLKTMKYFVRAALVAALIVAGTTSHAQAQALQSAAFDNEITAADVTCYTFNSNLTIGSQGGDVMALQIYLAQKGFLVLPAGQTPNINSYFGRLTKAAVAKYQSSVGISSSGYVGPLTRGSINTEFACSEGGTTSNDSGSNSGSQSSEEAQVVAYTNGRERSAAMVVGKPAITLERGINNEETNLVARFEILVAASKNSPVTFIGNSNIINFETKAGDGGQVRSLKTQFYSAKNVTATKNDYGYPLYVVAPNTVGRITLIARVNAKELFAGQYRAHIASVIYTQSNGEQMDELPVVNAGNKYTEQVRVIGEVSPYISSVSANANLGSVIVNGTRFNTNGTNKITVYANGSAVKTFVQRTESGSQLTFPVTYLPSSLGGQYTLTVTNSSLGEVAGLSNSIGFSYVDTVSSSGGNSGNMSDYVARIDSISPSPAPLGSKIKIKGANFGGFEADYIATLKRVSDGTSYSIRDDERTKEGRTNNGEMIITLKEPCKYGQKTYADYSGIEYICKLPPMTPGEYIVTVQTYGDQTRSNEYKLVVTNPTGAAVVAPSGITAEAHIVDVGSNYVGYWGVWQAGTGNANKTADDWHWAARITSPKAAVVKSVTITNGYGEGWSTSDTAKVNGVLTYPLKFKTATQENSGPNKTLTLNEGSTIVNFWGQVESRQYSGGTITLTLDDGSTVTATVPASSLMQGSTSSTQPVVVPATTQTQVNTQQSPSSIAPQVAVAPAQDSVEAHVVDAGSDYVGIWGTWKPGRGNTNPTNKDWHWAARLTTGAAKTIQSVTVTNGTESWSTSDIQVGSTPSYPLKYMSAFKTNSAVNDRFDVQAGSTVFNLWGQIETGVYAGGTIRVVFTDGSSVAAQIPASPIKPAVETVTSATVTNSTITEGIVSSSVTSGLPGSSVTLKLAGVKTPVTANDINIGPYAAQNLVFNATTNEVTFTIPWDMVVGSYDLVWFGPTSSYVIKFNVLNKSTFNFDASDLVGSVISVLKTLF